MSLFTPKWRERAAEGGGLKIVRFQKYFRGSILTLGGSVGQMSSSLSRHFGVNRDTLGIL